MFGDVLDFNHGQIQEKNSTTAQLTAAYNHPVLYKVSGQLSVVQRTAWNAAAVCLRESWQDFRAWRMEIRSAIGSGWFLPGGVIGVFCLPLITLPAQFPQFHVYLLPIFMYMDLLGLFSSISQNNLGINKYTDACDNWLEINQILYWPCFAYNLFPCSCFGYTLSGDCRVVQQKLPCYNLLCQVWSQIGQLQW